MFVVNWLSNIFLVRGLMDAGLVDASSTISYIGSGSYVDGASGDQSPGPYEAYGVTQAMRFYAQTKFLAQAWMQIMHRHVARSSSSGPKFVSTNPGPIVSNMGDPYAHLPAIL